MAEAAGAIRRAAAMVDGNRNALHNFNTGLVTPGRQQRVLRAEPENRNPAPAEPMGWMCVSGCGACCKLGTEAESIPVINLILHDSTLPEEENRK
eukprot:Skav221305  [mRNA]  locus=scaffold1920:586726:587657:- [translate_table: standard]